MSNTISLAVWDVPMPVVAGETFAIKAGAKAVSGEALSGRRVEVCDASGKVVASGALGGTPWPGTEALHWAVLEVPAPARDQVAELSVRVSGDASPPSRFSVAAAGKPEHTLTVTITESESKAALEGVEIRLGAFHARTDKSGTAVLRVCKGAYQLKLWRNGHISSPTPVTINGDVSLALTMTHVPEEHPDARWVR